MTSRLFLWLVMILSTSIIGRAQDRRTLEISETDTVLLNPTTIEYRVSAGHGSDFQAMVMGQVKKGVSEPQGPRASMQDVVTLLQSHHIVWEYSSEKGYSIGRSGFFGDSSIDITVHSEAELKSVYTLLSAVSGITGSIGQIEFEPIPDRVSIYKTLYQRALTDATGMAAVSGKTLGELLSVEEPQDILWSVRQMAEGTEYATGFLADLAGSQRGRLQKKVETKMLFKFELK